MFKRTTAPSWTMVIDEPTFIPGSRLAGRIIRKESGSPIDGTVELCAVDLIHGTKIFRWPLASLQLSFGTDDRERSFSLTIPSDALTRNDAPPDEPIDDSGWEVSWRLDRVTHAYRQVAIESGTRAT